MYRRESEKKREAEVYEKEAEGNKKRAKEHFKTNVLYCHLQNLLVLFFFELENIQSELLYVYFQDHS